MKHSDVLNYQHYMYINYDVATRVATQLPSTISLGATFTAGNTGRKLVTRDDVRSAGYCTAV
jgi:hypothetical protein